MRNLLPGTVHAQVRATNDFGGRAPLQHHVPVPLPGGWCLERLDKISSPPAGRARLCHTKSSKARIGERARHAWAWFVRATKLVTWSLCPLNLPLVAVRGFVTTKRMRRTLGVVLWAL